MKRQPNLSQFTSHFIAQYGIPTYIAVKAFYLSIYGTGNWYAMLHRRLEHYHHTELVNIIRHELSYHVKDCAQYQF
jgi:hypothetical protein